MGSNVSRFAPLDVLIYFSLLKQFWELGDRFNPPWTKDTIQALDEWMFLLFVAFAYPGFLACVIGGNFFVISRVLEGDTRAGLVFLLLYGWLTVVWRLLINWCSQRPPSKKLVVLSNVRTGPLLPPRSL